MPNTEDANSGWNTKGHCYYRIATDGDKLSIDLSFSSKGLDEADLATCDRINELYPAKMAKRDTWLWRKNWETRRRGSRRL